MIVSQSCRRPGLAGLALVAALSACEPRADDPGSDQGPATQATGAGTAGIGPPPISAATLPESYLGIWDVDAAACAGPPGELRLEAASDSIGFHESRAEVEAVRESADGVLSVSLAFEGEGERWRETRSLRLLSGNRLEVGTGNEAVVRVRCAGATTADARSGSHEWRLASSGEGDTLALAAPGGRSLVTLFCPNGPREFLVNIPGFRPVGSEERMSFGAGETVVALVADVAGDDRRGGVSGRSPVPPELLDILRSPGINVNYGFQNSGPHDPPPAAMARQFLAGCQD